MPHILVPPPPHTHTHTTLPHAPPLPHSIDHGVHVRVHNMSEGDSQGRTEYASTVTLQPHCYSHVHAGALPSACVNDSAAAADGGSLGGGAGGRCDASGSSSVGGSSGGGSGSSGCPASVVSVVMHVQQQDFEDWLLRALRSGGAS